MTPERDLVVREQWDVVRTMWELEQLENHITRFIEHTAQTMSTPARVDTPFGAVYDTDEEGNAKVEHPFGRMLSVVTSAKKGCFERYGEDMFRQGKLFDKLMGDENDA